MKNIEEFLKRFTIIKDPAKNKAEICTLIQSVCGITMKEENLKIQKGRLFIQAHPALLGVIFMKKEQLVKAISEALPDVHISSIS